jgi:hypothetical protein
MMPKAFSSEVGTGSREENASKRQSVFQAKWRPVRVKKNASKRQGVFQAKWGPVRVKKTKTGQAREKAE